MIGAVITKRKSRSGLEALNQHDLTKLMADWSDDCTFCFPGDVSVSGETKGRKALEARFARMMEQFPTINFTVKDVFVSNIFAMGATNSSAVEWEAAFVNREGEESHHTGVTTIRVKKGKIVGMTDYIFSPESLKADWGEV
jgi:ketosteroid isomerase-like protein